MICEYLCNGSSNNFQLWIGIYSVELDKSNKIIRIVENDNFYSAKIRNKEGNNKIILLIVKNIVLKIIINLDNINPL